MPATNSRTIMLLTVLAESQSQTFTLKNIGPDLEAKILLGNCAWCGTSFVRGASPMQAFCSSKCRIDAWRDARKAGK